MLSTPNVALSQTGGHSATLIENSSNIYFYLFSILNYKREQNKRIIGNCYSADHIAEDYIHTDITCNIKKPQQSTALKRSVIDY